MSVVNLPALLKSHRLELVLETPQSAATLYDDLRAYSDDRKRFCEDSHVGADLEELVVECFVEELYGPGAMHMITLRDHHKGGLPVGMVVWRQLGAEEMKEWLKLERGGMPNPHAVKAEGLMACQSGARGLMCSQGFDQAKAADFKHYTSSELVPAQKPLARTRSGNPVIDYMYDGWIKIELVAVHPQFYGLSYGTMLMSACLIYSYTHMAAEHSVLHIAGGLQNSPAVRLYEKFGFVAAPSSVFQQPNKHLFVLVDIRQTLEATDWRRLFKLSDETHVPMMELPSPNKTNLLSLEQINP